MPPSTIPLLAAVLLLAGCSKRSSPAPALARSGPGHTEAARVDGANGDPDHDDQLALEQLKRLHSDLSKPTEIVHYLYVTKRENAFAAVEELKKAGFAAKCDEPLGRLPNGQIEHRWSVTARAEEVPSLENLRNDRVLFEKLARRFDGEYDGWEAALNR